jgi:polyferredoxin
LGDGTQRASIHGVKKNPNYRRAQPEHSQQIRSAFQLGFLALNVWICIGFYRWVRFFETGAAGSAPTRPPGVEGWLPIASLMNLKVFLATGQLPGLHPAGLFLLLAFLGMSWLLRKSFCSWLCPVGTISEYLWVWGRKWFRRNWRIPRWGDIALRSLKYILMGLFLYAVASMSVDGIKAFLGGPYGVVADVKMLNFFRSLGLVGAIVLGALVLASVFIPNFWCRYLCPYGALFGFFSMLSPLRIKREVTLCIDCEKCAKACPSALPVDKLIAINSAECTGCMRCVTSCPAEGALHLSIAGSKKRIPAWTVAAGVAAIFLGIVLYARLTGHWSTEIPQSIYTNLVPRANEFLHP